MTTDPAELDPLTDLPGRAALLRVLEGGPSTLLLVDLDDFRGINEAFGHAVGDAVLRAAAGAIADVARRCGASAFRVAADEFAVVAPAPAPALADALRSRLGELAAGPDRRDRGGSRLRVSMGAASIGGDAADGGDTVGDAPVLLRRAALALGRAKDAGGDRTVVFRAAFVRDQDRRARLRSDLRDAIGSDQLRVVYQPVRRATDLALWGFEALLRWDHPTLGPVAPSEFIAIAETDDTIDHLGAWVLAEAVATTVGWRRRFGGDLRVAVNVAPRQLAADGFADRVTATTGRFGLPSSALTLELTETALADDRASVAAAITTLRECGVAIAVDDFGAGFASIGSLRRFRFDQMKLDRSLVAGLTGPGGPDPAAQALVAASIAVARALDMSVTAEGIEGIDVHAAVRRLGVDLVQGYLYGAPMSVGEATACLGRARRPVADPTAAHRGRPVDRGRPVGPGLSAACRP